MHFIVKDKYVCKDTNTQGKNTYIVALLCGGVMEDPDFHHENYQIIRANSSREAVEKYNHLNGCYYYYGDVVLMIDDRDLN